MCVKADLNCEKISCVIYNQNSGRLAIVVAHIEYSVNLPPMSNKSGTVFEADKGSRARTRWD